MSADNVKRAALAAALSSLAALVSPAARGDVGFLLPNAFAFEDSGKLTVIASFSDRFPGVEHPLWSDDFHMIAPDGDRLEFSAARRLEQMTVLTADLGAPGVYKLSTGERLGRTGEAARLGGALIRLGEDGVDKAALPEGAPILTSQTATVTEVYVRRGDAPAPEAYVASGRLSISLAAGEGGPRPNAPLRVSVSFDGAPLPGAEIALVAPFASYGNEPEGAVSIADDQGRATIICEREGPHVVFARRMAPAPAGAETDIRSYTTALVFNAAD